MAMNQKGILRSLVILVVFLIALSLSFLRGEYVEEFKSNMTKKVIPISNAKQFAKSSFFSKIFVDEPRYMNIDDFVFPVSEDILYEQDYIKKSLITFTDPYVIRKSIKSNTFDKGVCKKLKMQKDLMVSKPRMLGANHEIIQENFSKNKPYQKLLDEANDKFKSKLPTKSQWLRFGGSSVWLNDLKAHFMVSRLIYSPSGVPNKGFASFLYVQAYDENWKEITTTFEIPYEQFTVKHMINSDGSVNDVVLDAKLASRELSFPSLLPISFDYKMQTSNGKFYWGPEDPRILKRYNPTFGFEEPIVVFNMKDNRISKRVMHLYLPFSNKLKVLTKRKEKWAYIEKNWTPFISKNIDDSNKINFLYSITPLEVVSCEIDTGVCDFLQKKKKSNINKFGSLRGGTQLESIPLNDLLPDHIMVKFPKQRQIYVGWARTHLNKCGCGESMYRPNLIILVEDYNAETKKFYYKIADVSSFIDFNAVVPKWTVPTLDDDDKLIEDDNKLSVCDKSLRNVLIPNSIAYWDIESIVHGTVEYERTHFHLIPETAEGENKPIKYNDYMGVTLSASDSDVSIAHVNGLLDYILSIPSLFDPDTYIDSDKKAKVNGTVFNEKCSELAAKDYCISYAKKNGGVVEY